MSLFKLVKNAGVDRLSGYNLIRKVKLTNVISFIAGAVSVLNTLGFLVNGGKPETVLNTFAIAVFHFTTILWNKFGHYIISRIWFLTFLAYTVMSSAFFAGGNYLAEYIFIPCVGIPFLIYSNKELYISIIWSGIYFGLFFFQKYLYTVVTPLDPISVEEGAMMTKYLTALLFLGVIGIYLALSIESKVKESFIKSSLEKEKGLKEIAEANFTKLIESQKDLIRKERERIHAQKAEINALKDAESKSKLIADTHESLNDSILILSDKLLSINENEIGKEVGAAYSDLKGVLDQFFGKFNLSFQSTESNRDKSTEGDYLAFNLKVLLVDDMEINRSLAKAMLMNFGCEVTEATGGYNALESYQVGKFDLVLMDINMPDKMGDEAVKEIRSLHETDSVFVGLSANAIEGDLEEFKGMGLDDYISKPVTFEKLSQLLGKWFEVKDYQEPKTESLVDENTFLFSEIIITKNAELVGGKKNFIKFIDKFLSENKSIWVELNSSFAVKDGDKLKSNLHKLSGISSSMGAAGYAEVLNEAYKTLDNERFISDEEFAVLTGVSIEVDSGFREILMRWQKKES